MKTVEIKIIDNDFGPFRDTTVGKHYVAHILKGEDEIPEPWCSYPGQKNGGIKSILLLDDVGDDVLQNYDDYEGQTFIVI